MNSCSFACVKRWTEKDFAVCDGVVAVHRERVWWMQGPVWDWTPFIRPYSSKAQPIKWHILLYSKSRSGTVRDQKSLFGKAFTWNDDELLPLISLCRWYDFCNAFQLTWTRRSTSLKWIELFVGVCVLSCMRFLHVNAVTWHRKKKKNIQ